MKLVISMIVSMGFCAVVANAQTEQKKLFDRLGGKPGITKVIDLFVDNVLADESIRPFFAMTAHYPKRVPVFKRQLVDQICAASGGPCTYNGKDMKTAHTGMGIRDAHFTALVGALTKALDTAKVPLTEKNELLAVLGPMKSDIVEPK